MSNLFMRDTTINIGGRIFESPLTINFEVPFDDTTELNTGSVEIYNLTDSTIKAMKKGQLVTIQTGYKGDRGVIFEGIVEKVTTTREGVDKLTKIDLTDDAGGKWTDEKLKKTYKGPIDAKTILADLMPRVGLAIGDFKLPKNHTYKKGKTVNGVISESIKAIAKDCNAKVHVNKKKLYVREKGEADPYAVIVNKDTGLIGSPTPTESEETSPDGEEKTEVSGWKVTMLLNHRISTDSTLSIKSKTANGQFRVTAGKHTQNGDSFYTECDVYPL